MAGNAALDAALALARSPTLVHAMRKQPLPQGVDALLRLVADEPGALADLGRAVGHAESHLRGAVELYIQQVLLFSGAAPHRVLGAEPGASRAELRTHLRWLMTWLHPDKSAGDWRSVFAGRVLAAWREVSALEAPHGPRRAVAARSAGDPRKQPAKSPKVAALRRPRPLWVAHPIQLAPRRGRGLGRRAGWALALIVLGLAVAIPSAGLQSWLAAWLDDGPEDMQEAVGALPDPRAMLAVPWTGSLGAPSWVAPTTGHLGAADAPAPLTGHAGARGGRP